MVCFQYEVNCLGTEGISYKEYFMDGVRMRGEDYENKKDAAASMMIYLVINATAPFSDMFQKIYGFSLEIKYYGISLLDRSNL